MIPTDVCDFVIYRTRPTRRPRGQKTQRSGGRDAHNDPKPPNAAAATTWKRIDPLTHPQRHKATTPATIAAIGKPRPASGSLKKNIDAKDLRRFRVTRPFDSRRGASRRVVSTRDGE